MASKVEALVRNFLKTDGDALYLVPGERIFLLKGTNKVVVGRENLTEESCRTVGAELAPGEPFEAMVEARRKIPFKADPSLDTVEVLFGRSGSSNAIMIRRQQQAAPLPQDEAPYEPPAPTPSAVPSYREAASSPSGSAPVLRPAAPSSAGQPLPPIPVALREKAEVEALDVPDELRGGSSGSDQDDASGRGPRTSRFVVEKPIDEILIRMLDLDASDAHLAPGMSPTFRVHGELQTASDLPALPVEELERLLSPIVPDRDRKELAETRQADFGHEIKGASRFRAHLFHDRQGLNAVFRRVPLERRSAKELGIPPAVLQLGDLASGLVIVSGAAGSGRSTTLAGILDYVNDTRRAHVVTIEDPVEFVFKGKKSVFRQREVGADTRSAREALRGALREDADIILLGELEPPELLIAAVEAAGAGRLVLGTLRAPTATAVVDHLLDVFPTERQAAARNLVADSLRAVVAQTLVKRVGGSRLAAFEVLLSNPSVAALIREGKTFQLTSLQGARASGMNLMEDALLDHVKRGHVEPQEAHAKAADKNSILSLFKSAGVPFEVK